MNPAETLLKINELKLQAGKLSHTKTAEEHKAVFWKKFRLEFNYNSNHIEGNTLTYGHTELLLIRGKVAGQYDVRELEEMKAHDAALAVVRQEAESGSHTLTEVFIRQLNEIILVEPYYKDAQTAAGAPTRKLITPGKYKTEPNSVLLQTGEMFEYAKPEETPALMQELIEWYRKEEETKELHPVQLAALLHYKFVRIHPFDDSNGRTSRLLMNYVLLKNGYSPLVIESADKKNYLTALSQADTGDVEAFVSYITQKALRWQQLYTDALQGKNITEESDIDKQIELLKRKLSGGDKVNKSRTVEAVEEVIEGSLLPLMEQMEEKYVKLNELFLDYDRHLKVSTTGNQTEYSIGSKKSNVEQIKKGLLGLKKNNPQLGIYSVFYTYLFKAFKKSIAAQSCSVNVSVVFNPYNYTFKIEQKEFIKAYGEQLTKEEIQLMVQTAIDYVLQTIENFAKW